MTLEETQRTTSSIIPLQGGNSLDAIQVQRSQEPTGVNPLAIEWSLVPFDFTIEELSLTTQDDGSMDEGESDPGWVDFLYFYNAVCGPHKPKIDCCEDGGWVQGELFQ